MNRLEQALEELRKVSPKQAEAVEGLLRGLALARKRYTSSAGNQYVNRQAQDVLAEARRARGVQCAE